MKQLLITFSGIALLSFMACNGNQHITDNSSAITSSNSTSTGNTQLPSVVGSDTSMASSNNPLNPKKESSSLSEENTDNVIDCSHIKVSYAPTPIAAFSKDERRELPPPIPVNIWLEIKGHKVRIIEAKAVDEHGGDAPLHFVSPLDEARAEDAVRSLIFSIPSGKEVQNLIRCEARIRVKSEYVEPGFKHAQAPK